MANNFEKFIETHKANVETMFDLTSKAFVSVEKFVELNVTAARNQLHETAEHVQSVLSVKDLQEFVSLHSDLVQPYAEKAVSFGRHIYDIGNEFGGEFTKVVESKTAAFQQGVQSFVDTVGKNAPAGSETAVAFVKTAVNAANQSFDSVHKAVKQGVEVAQSNIHTVVDTALSAAKTAAPVGKTVARKRAV